MSVYVETKDQGLNHLLLELETEHAELDKQVAGYSKAAGFDQILLRRMKRRKLQLKDSIAKVRNDLVPDVIA